MHDMRLSEIEKKDFCTPKLEAPRYPHGLRINISKEQYEKFAFQSTPKLEDKFQMVAMVQVVETNVDDEGNPSFSLQIKELDLKEDKDEPKAEQVVYGES